MTLFSIFQSIFLQHTFLVLIVTFLALFVFTAKWKHKYWEKCGMPYLRPNLLFGNLHIPLIDKKGYGERQRLNYEKARSRNLDHVGLYAMWSPVYMPVSPEFIKRILTKDFRYFANRGFYSNERDDPLSANVVQTDHTKWRMLRSKCSPIFTLSKIRCMFPTLLQVGNQLRDAVDIMAEEKQPIDIKDIAQRFSMDVVGSCGLGIDCNSFTDPDSEFRKMDIVYGKETPGTLFKGLFCFSFPDFARFLRLTTIHKEKTRFFIKLAKETIEYRKKNKVKRNDYMQQLIDMKEEKDRNGAEGITISEVAADTYMFLIGAHRSTSSAIASCVFELASNPHIQNRLRDEILKNLNKHSGQITYEGLTEMKYMQQVIDETLRKHPSLPIINRQCVQDYQIPDTNITIKKGMHVFVSNLGLHYDPEYFPNPETFDPERFSDENKSRILPYTYLPFGEGPRNCLGINLGLMQVKIAVTVLLKHFTLTVNSKTKLPFVADPSSMILYPLNKIWLDVKKNTA